MHALPHGFPFLQNQLASQADNIDRETKTATIVFMLSLLFPPYQSSGRGGVETGSPPAPGGLVELWRHLHVQLDAVVAAPSVAAVPAAHDYRIHIDGASCEPSRSKGSLVIDRISAG